MNKWAEIAAVLGLKLNEKFKIKNRVGNYVFFEDGLFSVNSGFCERANLNLVEIISDSSLIIKKPWVPNDGEKVYYRNCSNDNVTATSFCVSYMPDIQQWKLGLLFRTEEEAETEGKAAVEALLAEYKAALGE